MTKTHARATTAPAAAKPAPIVQRACSCGHHAGSGPCERCRERAARRAGLEREGLASDAPSLVGDVIRSEGDALDTATRAFFENRFGQDLGRVRVHTGGRASASARAVDAQAYTVGNHVVFDAGRFNPASGPGRELLAHELVHTLQQRGADVSEHDFTSGAMAGARAAEPASEREAATIARSVAAGAKGTPRPVMSEGVALRRQANAAGTAATDASAGGAPAETWAHNVDLGRFGRYSNGQADARLNRRPALGRPNDDNRPPCQLDLFLKLQFDFHLGPSPYREGPLGDMTAPGPPWPADRASRWKVDYMRMAQETWRTRHAMERTGDCGREPCTRAVGHLRVVDTETMRDSDGQPVPGGNMTSSPHFTVRVFEFRPLAGRQESLVQGAGSTLYAEDVLPRGTPPPQGFDRDRYQWMPGNVPHETGHMLGRPHVNCSADAERPNEDRCYGEDPTQLANVMGRGADVSREDHAPFLAAMRATTNCAWEVPSGGLPWWAVLLISLTVVGAVVLGILALAGVI